ncbi:MAG: ribonuclease III [Rickettsiales bacterium]|jgi:ribonuclease-3|nr:ribonuclease III [Rickettsiales bacterium]
MKKLNYKFKNESLFQLALTQSGANAAVNNERLEFLGDRVLGLCVAEMLYSRFPNESEGDLARRHAVLVSADACADVAESLGLRVRHGHMTGGRLRGVLANAMESVLGAIYIDGGFDAARAVVAKLWTPLVDADLTPPKDAKTELQEIVQKSPDGGLPEYEFLAPGGPSHAPMFNVRVTAMGKSATGTGVSKKAATTDAAGKLLDKLK